MKAMVDGIRAIGTDKVSVRQDFRLEYYFGLGMSLHWSCNVCFYFAFVGRDFYHQIQYESHVPSAVSSG